MKNEKLSGALAVIILGLVGYQLAQCCGFRGLFDPRDQHYIGLTNPETMFLRLSGRSPDIFGPGKLEVVTCMPTPAVCAFEDAPADTVIPPYLLQEMRARNPNDLSIIATINETEAIEHGKFLPIFYGAGDGGGGKTTSAKVEIYDAKGGERRPGEKARFEGEGPCGEKEADACYDFSVSIRKFYKDEYGRNSIDGKGMKLISTVNFGQEFNNAFWDGVQCTYGRPGQSSPFKTFVLLDIAAHEVTHGVTQKETNLRYFGQAGALNESLSDVFGALIVQYSKKQKADQANWLVGDGIWKEGIKGRALRDMLNPGKAYDDPKVGKDPQPAHMKDYIKTRGDNGGVHYNSGIPNRAFATFARSVGGYAWKEPGQIWYKARKLSGENPSFAQFAYQTIEAAKSLGFEKDVDKLNEAWDTVGVKPSEKAKDTDTPRLNGEEIAPSRYY